MRRFIPAIVATACVLGIAGCMPRYTYRYGYEKEAPPKKIYRVEEVRVVKVVKVVKVKTKKKHGHDHWREEN